MLFIDDRYNPVHPCKKLVNEEFHILSVYDEAGYRKLGKRQCVYHEPEVAR
jgi:hypothetical protein